MIALLWIALAWIAGIRISRRLIGDSGSFLESLAGRDTVAVLRDSPWPVVLFQLSAGLWMGLLPLTWLTYGLAALLSPVLPPAVHPLLVVNTFVLVFGAVWLARPAVSRLAGRIRGRTGTGTGRWKPDPDETSGFYYRNELKARMHGGSWAALVRSLRQPSGRFYLMVAVFWLVLGIFLMATTFCRDGSIYRAGYSVFSDFAPHTAIVSSFSQGRNWPTEYPHFPNDGIAYHFMFYFLCGNLNYLGLPLDLAINLPSILGLMSFCLLLGLLAMRLTGRRATFLLAPAFLFFRSSCAFFTNLAKLAAQYGPSSGINPPLSWLAVLRGIFLQSTYIGNTPNDSWGLWGVNVYANQRHLLPGLSIALIILILFLPDLEDGLNRRPTFRQLFGCGFWKVSGKPAARRLAAALLMGVLLPYFHGSVTVSLVLVLVFIAIFSSNRLSFVIFCAATGLSALLQSMFFAGSVSHVVQPVLHFGFILDNPTLPGILLYLLEMSGFVLPLLAVAFWLPGRRRKILIGAFCLPLILALTVSLTPDVTVNHKYIMISIALCNIYIADLIAQLFGSRRMNAGVPEEAAKNPGKPPIRSSLAAMPVLRRVLAVILVALLTVTGAQEMIILRNINRNTVAIDADSPLVRWIRSNTSPEAIFVTAPYHYNSFYLSGRATWLGHAYYAWSAGHDTSARLAMEQFFLTGCDGRLPDVLDLIQSQGLDFLIIDDTLREHAEFTVDEAFFDAHFPVVATFPGLGSMKIYDLRTSS